MADETYSNIVVGIVVALATSALTLIGAWLKLTSLGITKANAAEVVDRAEFRKHLMDRIKQVEERLDDSEDEHEECLARERALQIRVVELERLVKG